MFDDPALQGLTRTALANNYDVRLAVARVAEARAGVGVSRSFWLPQVGGTALFQREKLSRTSVNPPVPPGVSVVDSLAQFNFDLFWEIDLFGRLRSLSEAAQSEFFASQWGQRAVWATVVADVARAYFELRTLDRQLEIARSTLASFKKSRRLVMLRHDRGLVSREDVAQADALVHTAGGKIPDLERQIGQKENQISILLGTNPQPIQRGKSLRELAVRLQVPAGLPSALLERRPDIRQSEAVLIATNYRIGAARANFFPRITPHRSGWNAKRRPGAPVLRTIQYLEYRPDLDAPDFHQRLQLLYPPGHPCPTGTGAHPLPVHRAPGFPGGV